MTLFSLSESENKVFLRNLNLLANLIWATDPIHPHHNRYLSTSVAQCCDRCKFSAKKRLTAAKILHLWTLKQNVRQPLLRITTKKVIPPKCSWFKELCSQTSCCNIVHGLSWVGYTRTTMQPTPAKSPTSSLLLQQH
jgi:hypothetical protein